MWCPLCDIVELERKGEENEQRNKTFEIKGESRSYQIKGKIS